MTGGRPTVTSAGSLDLRSRHHARLAQLDRALASGAKGHRFESCTAHPIPIHRAGGLCARILGHGR